MATVSRYIIATLWVAGGLKWSRVTLRLPRLMRSAVSLALLFGGLALLRGLRRWWAQVESNHRPRAYQARALTY